MTPNPIDDEHEDLTTTDDDHPNPIDDEHQDLTTDDTIPPLS